MTSFRALVHASVSILVIIAACPAFAQEATPGDACSTAGAFVRSGGPELSGVGHFMVCSGGTWASALSYSSTGNTLVPAGFSLTGDISPPAIGANQNNYTPAGLATTSGLRLTASGAYNITGLAGGADGRIVTVTNVGTNSITLVNESGSSTAGNRFALTGDLTLVAKQSAILMYDSTTSRWRQIANGTASSGGVAGGAPTNIQFNSGGTLAGDANFTYLNTAGAGILTLAGTHTGTASATASLADITLTVSPAGNQASGRQEQGLFVNSYIPGGNTRSVDKIEGINANAVNAGTGSVTTMRALTSWVENTGNAAVSEMGGFYGGASSSAGTVSAINGVTAESYVSGGTVTQQTGLNVYLERSGGTVTNRYGIYLSNPSGTATNDWGIYQNGSQPNRFNGNLGLGMNPGTNKIAAYTSTGDAGSFETAAASGMGIYISASHTTGSNYGLLAETYSTAGIGVRGSAEATTGTNYGVAGHSASTSGRGVYGEASATTGTVMGVFGETASTAGRGVYGYASAATGMTFGVSGESNSSTNGASGVYGHATAASGDTNGVFGESDSSAGWGVYGLASANSGTTYGVSGEANSSTGIGVRGYAGSNSGLTRGVAGYVESTAGTGVMGTAAANTGTNYGVYGVSNSTAGRGVYGNASAAGGIGVYGNNAAATGYGVYCNSGNANGCGGNRNWFNSSDARLKDHIVDLGSDGGLDAITRLRPVRYEWKDKASAGRTELGFIAQDVEKVLPELVGIGPDQEIILSDGSKLVVEKAKVMSYGQVTVPLVKAVQELKAENDNLRATINELNQRLDDLEARIK